MLDNRYLLCYNIAVAIESITGAIEMSATMDRNEAYIFIRRQFNQGNAWKDGIATRYVTRKSASFQRFRDAVESVGGEIWKQTDYQVKENVTRHEWACEAYIPDWRDAEADIYYDRWNL
jgi:hypothetical protein